MFYGSCFINVNGINLFPGMRVVPKSDSPSLSRFFHDIERLYALLVLYVKDKDPITYTNLVGKAKELHRCGSVITVGSVSLTS